MIPMVVRDKDLVHRWGRKTEPVHVLQQDSAASPRVEKDPPILHIHDAGEAPVSLQVPPDGCIVIDDGNPQNRLLCLPLYPKPRPRSATGDASGESSPEFPGTAEAEDFEEKTEGSFSVSPSSRNSGRPVVCWNPPRRPGFQIDVRIVCIQIHKEASVYPFFLASRGFSDQGGRQ
jgi:hypothetical protein